MHSDHLGILNKAFARCPDALANREQLKAQAFARAYLRHALVNYALGLVEQGRGHWLTAIRLCPEYATDRDALWQRITDSVVGFASLRPAGSRIRAARALLESILSCLPGQVVTLREDKEKLFARIVAELAHRAAQNKESSLARRCVLESTVRDPQWIRNRGMLKILLTGGRHLWPQPIDW
jgi:hypothetical protein